MIRVFLMLVALTVSLPAAAEDVRIDFGGMFTGSFSSPLVPVGTTFEGTLVYDSDAVAVITEPYLKRYSFDGPLHLEIEGTTYDSSFGAYASKSPFGDENVVFSADLGSGVVFVLRFDFLVPGSVVDFRLPGEPSLFDRAATASVSTAFMQGNFGAATADGSIAAPSVPEPSSWILLIVGFFGAGQVIRGQGAALKLLRRMQQPA